MEHHEGEELRRTNSESNFKSLQERYQQLEKDYRTLSGDHLRLKEDYSELKSETKEMHQMLNILMEDKKKKVEKQQQISEIKGNDNLNAYYDAYRKTLNDYITACDVVHSGRVSCSAQGMRKNIYEGAGLAAYFVPIFYARSALKAFKAVGLMAEKKIEKHKERFGAGLTADAIETAKLFEGIARRLVIKENKEHILGFSDPEGARLCGEYTAQKTIEYISEGKLNFKQDLEKQLGDFGADLKPGRDELRSFKQKAKTFFGGKDILRLKHKVPLDNEPSEKWKRGGDELANGQQPEEKEKETLEEHRPRKLHKKRPQPQPQPAMA